MRRAGGWSIRWGPDGQQEWDTFTCSHCNGVRFLAPRQEPEHRCKTCYGYICEQCANRPCLPLEEQLRMMEGASYRPRRIFRIG